MKIKHDRQADAIYVYLSDKPYAYGKELDDERRVDYSSNDEPIGIELLCVTKGVIVDDLPEREKLTDMLEKNHIRVYA